MYNWCMNNFNGYVLINIIMLYDYFNKNVLNHNFIVPIIFIMCTKINKQKTIGVIVLMCYKNQIQIHEI